MKTLSAILSLVCWVGALVCVFSDYWDRAALFAVLAHHHHCLAKAE